MMYPFDDPKRRKNPFDDFFSNDIDSIFREMEEWMKRAFKDVNFQHYEPGKSFVKGFNIRVGSDGQPRIEEFGSIPTKSPEGDNILSNQREPLTDIFECDENVSVTVELPGVTKEDINLEVKKDKLTIHVDDGKRNYHKTLQLPCPVKSETAHATYTNGVLDIIIDREGNEQPNGYKVPIN